jgi:excinuclease ABC subunit A
VHLARVFARLARGGDAVVIIEHHVELLSICDRLVELGPGGGAAGGRVVTLGTPQELAENPKSITGPWLPNGKSRRKPARGSGRKRSKLERGAV